MAEAALTTAAEQGVPSGTPLVSVSGVDYTLKVGSAPLHILRNVSFNVDAAQVVAIVGPSGSGKTSLLMLLGGLERATRGKVVIGGQDLTGLSEDALAAFRRTSVGIVFQSFYLIPSLSAQDNVSLALEIAEPGLVLSKARERSAAALCYTSGTTGNPKGVLYSHRSISVHATGICMADSVGLSSRDRALTGVPMYHVNAWGFPFAAGLTGFSPIFPTRYLQSEPLAKLMGHQTLALRLDIPAVIAAVRDGAFEVAVRQCKAAARRGHSGAGKFFQRLVVGFRDMNRYAINHVVRFGRPSPSACVLPVMVGGLFCLRDVRDGKADAELQPRGEFA